MTCPLFCLPFCLTRVSCGSDWPQTHCAAKVAFISQVLGLQVFITMPEAAFPLNLKPIRSQVEPKKNQPFPCLFCIYLGVLPSQLLGEIAKARPYSAPRPGHLYVAFYPYSSYAHCSDQGQFQPEKFRTRNPKLCLQVTVAQEGRGHKSGTQHLGDFS